MSENNNISNANAAEYSASKITVLEGLEAADSLRTDCEELIRILVSSIKTAKGK